MQGELVGKLVALFTGDHWNLEYCLDGMSKFEKENDGIYFPVASLEEATKIVFTKRVATGYKWVTAVFIFTAPTSESDILWYISKSGIKEIAAIDKNEFFNYIKKILEIVKANTTSGRNDLKTDDPLIESEISTESTASSKRQKPAVFITPELLRNLRVSKREGSIGARRKKLEERPVLYSVNSGEGEEEKERVSKIKPTFLGLPPDYFELDRISHKLSCQIVG